MFKTDSEFFDISKRVAEDFLQTVVIVDELAGFGDYAARESQLALTPPKSRPGSQREVESVRVDEGSSDSTDVERQHFLNATKVVDAFARKRIVCSVIRPDQDDRQALTQTLLDLSVCTDIVVVDWDLHGDNGELALNAISGMANPDGAMGRLRLIAIYTGSSDIASISTKVSEKLSQAPGAKVQQLDDGFTIVLGPNRILVFAKPETKLPETYRSRVVAFEDLAERLTAEFARMTASLVSNAVLASLAGIRRNAHKLLANFGSDLDAPYLTHRALLDTNPENAEEQLVALISEELAALLEEDRVGQQADISAIKAWLKERQPDDGAFLLGTNGTKLSLDKLVALLSGGMKVGNQNGTFTRKPQKAPLTEMFLAGLSQSASELDHKFAAATTMRAYYRSDPPLTLGTLLKETGDAGTQYWVCLQPSCDAIRLDTDRPFPLLPLEEVTDPTSEFDLVLRHDACFLRFRYKRKFHEVTMRSFKPDPAQRRVISKLEGGCPVFVDSDNRSYRWLGELKTAHAAKLAQELAHHASRIGVDESEWLRRWHRAD